MHQIDELIYELCPKGVKHGVLGDFGKFERGSSGLPKSDLAGSGEIGAIHYGQIHTKYGIWTSETLSFVTKEKSQKLRKARPGDLVIATTSEDDGAVAKAVAWTGEKEIVVGGHILIYRHNFNPKFIAYFITTRPLLSVQAGGE